MRTFISIFVLLFTNVSYAVVDKTKDKVITSLATEPVGLGNYLQMFFGLFIVVALVFGMAWFMKRMGNINGMIAGNLKVLGGVSVGQRERVVLVQAGDVQLLVGVAPGAVRPLHVLDKPITESITETSSGNSSSFADKLHAAIKNRSAS